ncbi:ComF family protein [Marinomonas colpomeniae]|uniref:ComF family protein n=1 Tax=Marinomonas colpomeniae TaxID=2774408 RepID=A0ABR8NUT5_9GAMM|nr:ComF family protein [Marinomonas colpomeniae]MBD5769815.1 ComF family protein [Marinomonas colpomeniae]
MDWKTLSTKILNSVYNRLFLTQCYLCDTKSKHPLCQHCRKGFTKNTFSCYHCKHPTDTQNILCGQCQISLPAYQNCIAPYRFEGIVKILIHSIKFNQSSHHIRPLTYLLGEELIKEYSSKPWPEQILYVPSHPSRIKERGFCQTQIMTKQLIKYLQTYTTEKHIKITHPNPIKKIKDTQAQHLLNKKERLKNPKNNYLVDQSIAKHVALFDDVMTTGSTIENCTKLLLNSGAEQVDIWVIARTPDKEH